MRDNRLIWEAYNGGATAQSLVNYIWKLVSDDINNPLIHKNIKKAVMDYNVDVNDIGWAIRDFESNGHFTRDQAEHLIDIINNIETDPGIEPYIND